MNKKSMCSLVLIVSLLGLLSLSVKIQNVHAPHLIITIEADGSISPPSANITTSDNVTYTFTADINASIIVQRSNIVIDGDGWTLDGLDFAIWEGFNLTSVSNVTIINVKIDWFASYSIYLESVSQCIISDNTITGSEGGIGLFYSTGNTVSNNMITGCSEAVELVSSSGNAVSGNNITHNNAGVYLVLSSTDNTIIGNNISFNEGNIYLASSFNNTITGNTITNGAEAIQLYTSSNNTISGNNMSGNSKGVWSRLNSTENVISRNTITSNADTGIRFDSSSDSTISENNVSENLNGVYLWHCSNITISGNNIAGNNQHGVYLFYSDGNAVLNNEFYANPSAGIYLLGSSDNRIWKNTNSSGWNSQYGVCLWSGSHRNTVSENTLSPYWHGISMGYSDDNRILNNTVSNTEIVGIEVQQICNNSIIANNMISDSSLYGISIASGSEATRYNVIQDNNITHNLIGINIHRLSGNIIYHNNFVDNTNQTSISNSTNIWDNGYPSGGNYWSNYTGVDLDPDGIGDVAHVIDANNTDNYPLMGMFHSFNTSLGKSINVISNSSVSGFMYESPGTIRFHVSNKTANQTHGFCRVSIPYEVLSEPFNVTIDGANPTYWNYTLYDNGTHRWIYFEIEHSTKEVVIIPEFPSHIILPLFITATLVAALAYRRKRL